MGPVAFLRLSGGGGDAGEEASLLLLPPVKVCSIEHGWGGESRLQGLACADPSIEGHSSVAAHGVGV